MPRLEFLTLQGEDLLTPLVAGPRRRRLPILLAGAQKDQLTHLGLLDLEHPWKLDLPLEAGAPELYDLRDAQPDEADHAPTERASVVRLLKQLTGAPGFPR